MVVGRGEFVVGASVGVGVRAVGGDGAACPILESVHLFRSSMYDSC